MWDQLYNDPLLLIVGILIVLGAIPFYGYRYIGRVAYWILRAKENKRRKKLGLPPLPNKPRMSKKDRGWPWWAYEKY